jgi:DNA-binding NarL/FixJ family response regulator
VSADALLDRRVPRPADRTADPRSTVRRTARLLIVDDSAIVRFGLRALFAAEPEVVVVGEAAGPRDALALADRCPPDLVVLDVDLGRGGVGIDLAHRLLERHRGVRVLVLTGSRDRELMMRAMRLGVHGFLRKSADTGEVLAAVRSLLRGEAFFAAGAVPAGPAVGDLPAPEGPRGPMLTERENQVLKLLAVGMSNREIADRLVISEATVKFHVRNLRDKLEVRRRTQIVHTATRQGIV